jgi:hypothetical protein
VDPPLNEVATGHEVACHFADQVEGSKEQVLATGRGRASTATEASVSTTETVPASFARGEPTTPAATPQPPTAPTEPQPH